MTTPGKIICVGRNYRDHAKELGNDVPKQPLLFFKPATSMIRGGAAIELPPDAGRVDYEGEIGVAIGAKMRRVTEAEAIRGIRGLFAANDVSAREWQKSDDQWARAKGCDTFLAIGNEVPAPADLSTVTVVTLQNGVEKQRATGADMVFSIPFLISYISRYMTLEPGDLLLTGTPAGVGPIAPGDTVEIELVGLSKVSNPVVAGQ
jgi:2-keto-4-pentenoate hydratase/2-oxohepta-3-ene-1,7-dioic acid hydratase in catechol pathway